jgi:hypothetical protein
MGATRGQARGRACSCRTRKPSRSSPSWPMCWMATTCAMQSAPPGRCSGTAWALRPALPTPALSTWTVSTGAWPNGPAPGPTAETLQGCRQADRLHRMQIQHRRAERPASWRDGAVLRRCWGEARRCRRATLPLGGRLAGAPRCWVGPADRAHHACALGAVLCAVREASIAGVARPVMPFPLPCRRCREWRVTSSGPGRCPPHSPAPARPPPAHRGRSGWCGA